MVGIWLGNLSTPVFQTLHWRPQKDVLLEKFTCINVKASENEIT